MYWVYDIESYPNIFTFVFRKVSNKREIKIFEISSRKNDILGLISFLNQEKLVLIGYNNVGFDYPILHKMMQKPNISLQSLFDYVQDKIINEEYPNVWENQVKIPQIDLYKIWHYDNTARRCSLKWLEFSLNWYKVQDLPFKPGDIIPENRFDDLIEYNINDVDFTYEFFGKSLDAIQFRVDMSAVLEKNVMNYSDVKIGEYLNRITYEKLSGIPYKEFKDLQTERNYIPIKELIPDFVKFKTKNFQKFLEEIKNESINANTKDDWDKHITIGSMTIKFAKGGLHSKDSPGIISCLEGYFLKEKDVGSMYPKAMIAGNMYPKHLGEDWNRGIKKLYDERTDELKPALKKLEYNSKAYKFINSKQNAYKLAMNGGGYGKTGADFGWQKDKMVMFKVTFRGQLSLLMLLEEYHLIGIELLSANTDGIVIHYPKERDKEVQEIHDKWEIMTNSILEDTFYKQIISRDVNNYIAEIINGDSGETIKFKYKGCFEIDPDFHKNKSQRIVPIALKEYFVNKTPIFKTITEHKEIYDFCLGKKGTKSSKYTLIKPNERKDIPDKVVRYFISNNGYKMYKLYKDGRVAAVSKGFKVSSFMEYYKSENYDIDYNYYMNECRKIITPILMGTLKMKRKDLKSEQLNLF